MSETRSHDSRQYDSRPHGERIALLEKSTTALEIAMIEVKNELKNFNKRWYIGVGIFCGVMMLAGSGTVSLKSLLEWIGHLHP